LDEANLSKDQVLSALEHCLTLNKMIIINGSVNGNKNQIDGTINIRRHPDFRLFLAQNPGNNAKYSASRNIFSASFLSNFLCVTFESIP
jgi:midasin (ATPase involved in ribosome maturation)